MHKKADVRKVSISKMQYMSTSWETLSHFYLIRLFNDVVSNPGYTAPNDWMRGNNAKAWHKRHLHGRTEGYHE
jgi:hypothetical protein